MHSLSLAIQFSIKPVIVEIPFLFIFSASSNFFAFERLFTLSKDWLFAFGGLSAVVFINWHLDMTVSKRLFLLFASRIIVANFGGSSSVFRKAFWACRVR